MTGSVFCALTVDKCLNCVDLSVAATAVLSDSELDSFRVIVPPGSGDAMVSN